jgi:hypothetical protein
MYSGRLVVIYDSQVTNRSVLCLCRPTVHDRGAPPPRERKKGQTARDGCRAETVPWQICEYETFEWVIGRERERERERERITIV